MLLRIFTEPQQGASYDDQLAVAQKTEELGFDAYFRSDHYLAMGDTDGLPGPTDAWITLAGLARETSRIKLGTLVSPVTFRSPGPLAISVAQVDHMSVGRVELGLGAGWFQAEHEAYAMDFPDTVERFDLLEEQVEIVTGLWTTPIGERYDFAGKHYTVKNSPGLPKPVQQPHPPIVIGGSGKKRTPALAAKYAAEFNSAFKQPDEAAVLYDRVRAACEAIGRDPKTIAFSASQTTCVGRDDAELKRRAAAIGQTVEQLASGGLYGTPNQVVDKIGRYAEAGASRFYLQIMDLEDLEHLEFIAAEVLPQLA